MRNPLPVLALAAAISPRADTAWTDFPSPVPKTIGFEFSRIEAMENNARAWWSFNQGFGKASLWIGEAGGDRHWAGRLGQFLGWAWLISI